LSDSAKSRTSKLAIASLCLALVFLFIFMIPVSTALPSIWRVAEGFARYPWLRIFDFYKGPNIFLWFEKGIPLTIFKLSFFAGPVGFVCALVSFFRIKRSKGQMKGMKATGIAILILAISFLLIFLIMISPKGIDPFAL